MAMGSFRFFLVKVSMDSVNSIVISMQFELPTHHEPFRSSVSFVGVRYKYIHSKRVRMIIPKDN